MAIAAMEIEAFVNPEDLPALRMMPARADEAWDDIPSMREGMAELTALMPAPALPPDVSVEDHYAPGPDGAPDVMVRLYRPVNAPSPVPALYYIHGGGMILGSVAMTDPSCAAVASELNVLVASVEYRLAPEHPFPAPMEDCYAGLRWLAQSADEFDVDLSRVAVGGGSAGGGLAAGLALLARDRGEVAICFQQLVFPMLDDRNDTRSAHAILDGRVWNRASNAAGWNAYLSGNAGGDDVSPYAAPARAEDLSGLPPAYINVGTADLFVDEDIAYAQALLAANVPCELKVYPGAFHGSAMLSAESELSQRWRRDEMAALDRALNGGRG